jgi:GNAT superfamily N-acetyltransferase
MYAFHLRDALPADASPLSELFRRASLSNDGDREALLARPDVLAWPGPPVSPARCRVATDGEHGPAVGFATVVPVGDTCDLEDLFVEPASMRRGVGRLLVDDALEWAATAGFVRVTVDANPHARAFYGSVGFVVDGPVVTELGPGLLMHRAV